MPRPATTSELLDRYAGVLIDLYGVIVDARGLLPGAAELLAELERRAMPYAFVTNDASRSVATYVQQFARFGLRLDPARLVTSGSLLPGYLSARGLAGARVCVLGTEDSAELVRASGAAVVPPAPGIEIDALAVCDDAGFPFLAGSEHALSAVVRAVDAGRRVALVLPNPDLVYPKGPGELGFTAGAIALMIEAVLARRYPGAGYVFDRLGKPERHLFDAAARALGVPPEQLVMIGDQLETDVAGARAAGCDAALLAGISRWTERAAIAPTWLLDRLWP